MQVDLRYQAPIDSYKTSCKKWEFRQPTSHLSISMVMPSKHLPFHLGEAFSRLLLHLCLFFHPQGIPPLTGAHHEWCNVPSCAIDVLDHFLSLLSEVDLSFMANPGTPPEHLVDTVHSLGPFLPIECELLGQGDLKIVGSHPIDADGFTNVWVGERYDGTKVAIKSHRCYSSSGCLSVCLVSVNCSPNEPCSLNLPRRGCTRKH